MRLLIALVLTLTATAQRIEFGVVDEHVLEQRLRLAHPRNAERYVRMKALFEQIGCAGADYREQRFGGSKEPNIICTVPGTADNPRTILVGAHFDADPRGEGVIDNWTGAILLPSLAEFMRTKPRRHTYEFVAFAGEEKGLLGSRAYLRALSKADLDRIAAVVTMDSLGLGPTKCWPNGSSEDLMKAAYAVAGAMTLDLAGVNVDAVGTTDSQTFKALGIPVLSLHSVTPDTWKVINSKRDVWSAVKWRDYYDSHRLISALLVYLDGTLQ